MCKIDKWTTFFSRKHWHFGLKIFSRKKNIFKESFLGMCNWQVNWTWSANTYIRWKKARMVRYFLSCHGCLPICLVSGGHLNSASKCDKWKKPVIIAGGVFISPSQPDLTRQQVRVGEAENTYSETTTRLCAPFHLFVISSCLMAFLLMTFLWAQANF